MYVESLVEIRRQIERCATSDGRYRIACARTGESPVPVSGLRFPNRAVARRAARDAQRYRVRLRSLEPQTPWHYFVIHEDVTVSDLPSEIDAVRLVSSAFQSLADGAPER